MLGGWVEGDEALWSGLFQKKKTSPGYSRILICSRQWSIRGQTYDWRYHYKVFLLHFRMEESFENIFRKDKERKRLVEALDRCEKPKEVRKSRLLYRKWLRKYTRAFSVGSWARLNQTQNWSCFVSNLTINKQNSDFLSLKIIIDTEIGNELSNQYS